MEKKKQSHRALGRREFLKKKCSQGRWCDRPGRVDSHGNMYTGEFRPGVGSRSSSGLTEHYDRSADDQLLAIRCEAAQASAGLFPPPVPV